MYKTKPLTAIFLDTRRPKNDETYPVKLRVTFNRKRKYYSINDEALMPEDFEKVMGQKPRGKYKSIRNRLDDMKHDADEVIKNLKIFSFEKFEMELFNKSKNTDDVFSQFDLYINDLKKEGRISTADSYSFSKKSLQSFCSKSKLSFDSITKDFLEKYETEMLKNGRSITTIGIYLRSLRTIVNAAIKKGITDHYPFGKGNNLFIIKNPPARKMALTTSELKSLFNFSDFESNAEHFYFDLWKFSYLCSGMNMKDICNLTYKNIVRDRIFYRREKTKRSNYNGKEITILISDDIKRILMRWGQKPKDPEKYIFPILQKNMSPEKQTATVKQITKQVNKYVNRIANHLDIGINVTTYTARHSYATQLMRHGAPTEFISKQLGHSNIGTTASYLENFEERQLKEWQEKVTDFEI